MNGIRILESDRAGDRLDIFLTQRCSGLSRSRIKKLIIDGYATIDGKKVSPAYKLRAGQRVTIEFPAPSPTNIAAQRIPLSVVYEDDDMLVIDKPAGMAMHPGAGQPDATMVNALLGMYRDIASVGGVGRPGLVHRLDKDTSGLVAVARTDAAHAALSAQFRDRTVSKRYLALVSGTLDPPHAIIDAPIGRHPRDRKRMAIVEGGRPSVTAYRTIASIPKYTFAEAHPRTGRTHQIRVHFASVGHPTIGDALYGHTGHAEARLGRHFLHAAGLELDHPTTGARVSFECPMPEDLRAFLMAVGLHTQEYI